MIDKPIKNEDARVVLNSYKENIQTIEQGSTIVEWKSVVLLLELFIRQLHMKFPKKNEYSKNVWILIETICNDLDIDPDSL